MIIKHELFQIIYFTKLLFCSYRPSTEDDTDNTFLTNANMDSDKVKSNTWVAEPEAGQVA